ncbi:M20/M25/M40 family metallo-hydrolase [Brevundimonas sp. VNH65]|uniref:M20/M25/M40 family metallo-hydrolase n=1 Tax=Brevundimonas sp. VNH65 TaxID=3400917 RepID=UPI003BFB228D
MTGRVVRATAQGLILGLALAWGASSPVQAQTRDAAAEARIQADVAFLADDALEGRGNGQRGYDLAALYVQSRMQAIGLKPGGVDGTWRQPFAVARIGVADDGATLTLRRPGGQTLVWSNGENALLGVGRRAGHETATMQLAFVGFGAAEDYADLDVAGKAVVVLSGAPRGMAPDAAARLEADKTAVAEARGAIAVITVNTEASARRFTDALMKRMAGRTESAWVGADGLTRRANPGVAFTAFLGDAAAEALFQGADRSYAEIRRAAAAEDGRPSGFILSGEAIFDVHTRRDDLAVSNVIGRIEGTDPDLKAEHVVITAHLDHLGMTGSGEDRINNGALDNAGGVAAMLEAARALAASPPRRSVLVVALAAEEVGLIGSDYLARHPVVDDVAANVNLDMPVLTYGFSDVVAFGAEHSTMGPRVDAAARAQGVKLSPDPMPEQNVFTRSDHYSFVRAGVPSVMLATGYADGGEAAWGAFFAEKYHKHGDEIGANFDWDAAARFARINAAVIREVADADQRPLWYEGNTYGDRFAAGQPRAPAPTH